MGSREIDRAVKLIRKGLDPFSESRPRSYSPLKVRPKRAVRIKQKAKLK